MLPLPLRTKKPLVAILAKTYRNDVADKYANWGTGRVGSLSLVTIARNTGKLAADTGLGPETFSAACKHCGFYFAGRGQEGHMKASNVLTLGLAYQMVGIDVGSPG